jgi:transposase
VDGATPGDFPHGGQHGNIRVVYEAGPCGYGLYRHLLQKGFDCMVCAPSLIPREPGERVKTDRRDAVKPVRLLRNGDLSAVYVPTVEVDEAFCDLARAWVSAKDDMKRARQRPKAFLLSHGVRYVGRADWGTTHRRWVSAFSLDNLWQQIAFDELRRTIEDRLAQCERLEGALREAVLNWRFYPAVLAQQAMRGVQFTTALGMLAELGDLSCVDHLQIGGNFALHFPRHEVQAVAHHVKHAKLHGCFRIDRFNGFGKAFEPIDAGDKNVLHAACF